MLRELKYLVFLLVIILFISFSFKFYISDENKKKTIRYLNSIDNNLGLYESSLPLILNDTNNIVNYLNNENRINKKKYSFWNLLRDED